MTARIFLILGKPRGHRPRLQNGGWGRSENEPPSHRRVARSASAGVYFLWASGSLLNVTESDKPLEDGNGRVHDDRVILAVLSSEFEDPFEGVVEQLVARGNTVIR